MLSEGKSIPLHESLDSGEPGGRIGDGCTLLQDTNSRAELAGQGHVTFATVRITIQCLVFVEADQFHRPFDRLTRSVIAEGAVRLPRNGDDAPVELWGKLPVYLKFGITGGSALLQRRIVEIWKPDCAFDLDGQVSGEKNYRSMRVEAADLGDAVNVGIREEPQNRVLQDWTCGLSWRVHS